VLVEVSKGSLTRYGDAYDGLWSALDRTIADYTEAELVAIERWGRQHGRDPARRGERLAAIRGAG